MDITFPRMRAQDKKMADFDLEKPQNKSKAWQVILLLVLLGLAVNLILPKLMDIRNAIAVVREMTWWLVALAVLAEVVAYLGIGFCLQSLLGLNRFHLNVIEGAMISVASASIGLVAGGWVGAAAATYRYINKRGATKSSATIAGVLPSMLLNAAIIVVGITGTIFLKLTNRLTQAQLVQYSVFILVLIVFTYGYLLALVFPNATYKVVNWALWTWSRWRKKPYDPVRTKEGLETFIRTWKMLRGGNWLRPLLGASSYVVFDMLCLYLVFLAAGYQLNFGLLLAGYGLPLLFAKMAFILPGGVGVIEATMTAIFTSLGVPKEVSIVAVVGYRLISFWLMTFVGFILNPILSRAKAFQTNNSAAH